MEFHFFNSPPSEDRKEPFLTLICIILILFMANCTTSLPKDVPKDPKTYKNKVNIRLFGNRRSYLVHVPPITYPQIPLPLVVAIHGAFETAKDMEERSSFSELANSEGFVTVYPNGMGLFGFLQHWNAGHCCGKAAADGVDDVEFIAEVIKDVQNRFVIDPHRIYMVGFSNGGMLAYRFAAEKSDILTAFATVAATIGSQASDSVPLWRIPHPKTPLPLITFHGLSDDAIPLQGGASHRHGGDRSFVSVEDSTKFWVQNNGCDAEPVVNNRRHNNVRIQTWKGCRQDARVVLYLIENWGHSWPGQYYTKDLDKENPLNNFDAAAIIWDFFKSYSKTH